jgi:hypothetical protein
MREHDDPCANDDPLGLRTGDIGFSVRMPVQPAADGGAARLGGTPTHAIVILMSHPDFHHHR